MRVAVLLLLVFMLISSAAIGFTWGIDKPLGSEDSGKKKVKVIVANKKQQKQPKRNIIFVDNQEIIK